MVTREQADRWLEAYGAAWEARDGAAAARLFTEQAAYWWGPYDPPLVGREAISARWTAETAQQRDVVFSHDVLGIDGDRVFDHWHSVFVDSSTGAKVELDGVFVLDFAGGVCGSLQEWWLTRS